MKNFSKTIACLSLSLLTIGAMAQTESKGLPFNLPSKVAQQYSNSGKVTGFSHATSKKVTSGTTQAYVDYVDGDFAAGQYVSGNPANGGNFVYWAPLESINHYYTVNDTGTDNSNHFPSNAQTINSVTVAFDTIYDYYTGQLFSAGRGSVTLDTIWANVAYHKTGPGEDTCIFWINEVDAYGFPTSHVISSDTVFLDSSSFSSVSSMDSIRTIYVVPPTPISIPTSARRGWNFCVTVDYHNADKLDTFAVQYYSSAGSCSNIGYTYQYTYMGVPAGYNQYLTYTGQPNTGNSWSAGYYWYNRANYQGNGSQLVWPDTNTTGGNTGLESNGHYYWYTVACPGDTGVWSKQDYSIFASIAFNNTTGVNNIAASGLSVGQNYPNPYNKQTQIAYSLTKSSTVTFTVYDITGRVIMTDNYNTVAPGQHEINLSANSFSPGIYFYTFNVNGSTVTKKMVVTE